MPKTLAIYVPFHKEKEPYAGVKIVRDAKYGAHERQALDVFMPENMSGGPRPVFIWVHGGAFVGGNKKSPQGAFFYDNVGVWAARNGMIGVNINYPPRARAQVADRCTGHRHRGEMGDR